MTKTYVRTDYTGCSYLTAGKLYEALEDEGKYFKAVDDEGDIISCRWSSCGHIYCNDWEVVTVGYAHELNLKLGDVVRVVDTGQYSKHCIGEDYKVMPAEDNPNDDSEPFLQNEDFGWMPIDHLEWTYEVISRANTEETQEWSSWNLSPKDGSLKTIKGEPLKNFEIDMKVLEEGEPQFAYRYKTKEPEPELEVGKVYYSKGGSKWECVAIRGNTAFLSGVYSEGYSAAYKFKLDGTPICLSCDSSYTIDFTKGDTENDFPQ